MAANAKKSKKFRIATEGATVDGRTISREWIQQMAANYDPKKYQASINLEHYKGILPDGPFRAYGKVSDVSQADNAEGKAELFGVLEPTDDLVAMTAKGQKVFTSIEVNPKFADTGEAYLVGLAVTDNPASLGTEVLAFAASHPDASPFKARKQHPGNHFSAAIETTLEFVDDAIEDDGFLARFRAIFAKKATNDEARFDALQQGLTEMAEHGNAQSTQTAKQFQAVDGKVEELTKRIGELEAKFDTTPANKGADRPRAVGNDADLTDC